MVSTLDTTAFTELTFEKPAKKNVVRKWQIGVVTARTTMTPARWRQPSRDPYAKRIYISKPIFHICDNHVKMGMIRGRARAVLSRGRPGRPNDIDKNPITMKGYIYMPPASGNKSRDSNNGSTYERVSPNWPPLAAKQSLSVCSGWHPNASAHTHTHGGKANKKFGSGPVAAFFAQEFS